MRRIIPLILFVLIGAARAEDRPFLGVAYGPVNEGKSAGVLLTEIIDGSAAEGAGFRPGDIIAQFDGKEIDTPERLLELVQGKKPGDKVAYVLQRGTGRIEGTVTLGSRAEEAEVVMEGGTGGEDDVEVRIERARKRVEEMQRRVASLSKAPRGLKARLHQEEAARERAAAEGKPASVAWHEARIDLLRNLIEQEGETPQLDRIEKKLDHLIAALTK